MSKPADLGIYLKTNKTFYYLEYGDNYVQNTLDRIRKTLIQRNQLDSTYLNSKTRSPEYEVMTFKQAHDNSLEMKPIYISKHIQSLLESSEKNLNKKGSFK